MFRWTTQAEHTYKTRYAEMRDKARHSISGDVVPEEYVTIMDLDDDALERELDRTWAQGGFYTQYPYTDLLTSHEANERVAEYSRNHIRTRVKDTPSRGAPLCQGPSLRHQTAVRRLLLLRDLQRIARPSGRPANDADPRESTNQVWRRATDTTTSTLSSSPPASTP